MKKSGKNLKKGLAYYATLVRDKIQKIAIKTAADNKKGKLQKNPDSIGEQVNQLKRNIIEKTTTSTIKKNRSFNIGRNLDRELLYQNLKSKKIINETDLFKHKQEILLIEKIHLQLKESLRNLEKHFFQLEKSTMPWKTKTSVYKDEIKFIGEQINQLKLNIIENTKAGSKVRIDSFKSIGELERELKNRDPRFNKIIKRAVDLLHKNHPMTEHQKTRLSKSLIESRNTINKTSDSKENKEAIKGLTYYAKKPAEASPQINKSNKRS